MSSRSKRTTFKRMMAMFLVITTMLSMMVFPAAAAPAETKAEGYVTDDLVLWLDVNNNTGEGTHDPDATEWVNLADPTQKIAIPDGSAHSEVKGVWGADNQAKPSRQACLSARLRRLLRSGSAKQSEVRSTKGA